MLMSVCTWENVIAQLKNGILYVKFFSNTFCCESSKAVFPWKSFCDNSAVLFKLREMWNMVLTRKKKFCGAMMGQKTENDFLYKKDSI